MTISRDTIIDLLPLYLSGEASPATQELVKDYLSRDPELASIARQQQAALQSPATASAVPDLETTSFRRTRRRLAAQRWTFGLAWLFTAATLSTEVTVSDGHVTGARLALIDAPFLLGVLATLAVICWVAYGDLRRRG